MLIFGQNEMKDSVEWKVSAVTGAGCGGFLSMEGEKPKDVLDLKRKKKKIFKQLALEQMHKKIHPKATVFLIFRPSTGR